MSALLSLTHVEQCCADRTGPSEIRQMDPTEPRTAPSLFTASDVARSVRFRPQPSTTGLTRVRFATSGRQGATCGFVGLTCSTFSESTDTRFLNPKAGKPGRLPLMTTQTACGPKKCVCRRFDLITFQDPFDAWWLSGICNLMPSSWTSRWQGSDGFRLLERLKGIDATSHIRAVVYSGHEDLRKSALEKAGAYDFVAKGEVSGLRDALERLMGLDRVDPRDCGPQPQARCSRFHQVPIGPAGRLGLHLRYHRRVSVGSPPSPALILLSRL